MSERYDPDRFCEYLEGIGIIPSIMERLREDLTIAQRARALPMDMLDGPQDIEVWRAFLSHVLGDVS